MIRPNMPIYTYQQLKGRIKVGDTVSAALGFMNACGRLGATTVIADSAHAYSAGKITEVGQESFYIDGCRHDFDENASLELIEEEKTLDTVDVGDPVWDEDGNKYIILDTSKNGNLLALSGWAEHAHFYAWFTRQQLEESGHTVKQDPQPVIMTCEEAERELSKDGKQVKIV